MNFDLLDSHTCREQRKVEYNAAEIYSRYMESQISPEFNKEAHVKFIQKGLKSLPAKFVSLESSRPWLLYWMTHSLALLNAAPPDSLTTESETLSACK